MPSSIGQDFASTLAGELFVTSVTTLPMKTGMVTSSSATAKPTTNSAMNRPLDWRAKCQ